MAAPLITTQDVIASLNNSIPTLWAIPLYDDFPSDSDIVRYGIYVSDVHSVERNPYKLGTVYGGGSIYTVHDQFEIVYVSFQDDQHNLDVNNIISELCTVDAPNTTTPLFDGYYQTDFDQVLFYGVQAEKHTWTFHLHRLEFQ